MFLIYDKYSIMGTLWLTVCNFHQSSVHFHLFFFILWMPVLSVSVFPLPFLLNTHKYQVPKLSSTFNSSLQWDRPIIFKKQEPCSYLHIHSTFSSCTYHQRNLLFCTTSLIQLTNHHHWHATIMVASILYHYGSAFFLNHFISLILHNVPSWKYWTTMVKVCSPNACWNLFHSIFH